MTGDDALFGVSGDGSDGGSGDGSGRGAGADGTTGDRAARDYFHPGTHAPLAVVNPLEVTPIPAVMANPAS
ncbi:hypothetical protein ACFWIF_05120, partial [Corynebacterium bovis]